MGRHAIVRPTQKAIEYGARPESQTVRLDEHIPSQGPKFGKEVIGQTIFLTCTHRDESEVTVLELVDEEA